MYISESSSANNISSQAVRCQMTDVSQKQFSSSSSSSSSSNSNSNSRSSSNARVVEMVVVVVVVVMIVIVAVMKSACDHRNFSPKTIFLASMGFKPMASALAL